MRLLSSLWRRRSGGRSVSIVAHEGAVPDLAEIGEDVPPYRKTYDWAGDFIDSDHRALASLPVEGGLIRTATPGFLRPADALALYELAYFANGDVLEMGSAWGLSTTILCRAVRNAADGRCVSSIEIARQFQKATRGAIAAAGLRGHHRLIAGDARVVADRLIGDGRRFGFAFIDHDHAYEPTRRAFVQLDRLLSPGAMVLFHDFIDVRNRTEPAEYGVHRAVSELAQRAEFTFLGAIGCCGLLQRRPE